MGTREKKPLTFLEAPDRTRLNWFLLSLLELVDEFQADVKEIRKKHGIPLRGYLLDEQRYVREGEAEEKQHQEIDKKLDELGRFTPESDVIQNNRKIGAFEGDIKALGDKFSLPHNFSHSCFYGLATYILANKIIVPEQNWDLVSDFGDDRRRSRHCWVGIRAYSPLKQSEAKAAICALNEALRSEGTISQHLVKERRAIETLESNLERLLPFIEQMKKRDLETVHENYDTRTSNEQDNLENINEAAYDLFGYYLWKK